MATFECWGVLNLYEICFPGSFTICGEASCVSTCMRQVLGYSGFMRDQYVDFERPQANFLACFGYLLSLVSPTWLPARAESVGYGFGVLPWPMWIFLEFFWSCMLMV